MGKMKEKDIEFLNGYYSEDEDMGADSYTEKEIDTDVPEERNGLYSNEILEKIIGVNRINYYPKNYSIDWLVDRLGSGKFSMPKYQRKYVWLDHQVTALIVSVLKKIPIPKLYGYYTESQGSNQTTLIIDGQQRLTSLFMYYWGIFPKSKNNRINYAEHLESISALCKIYYDEKLPLPEKKAAKERLNRDFKLDVDFKFTYKSNEFTESQKYLDLSYRGHSDLNKQQKFRLLDSEIEFLIVEGSNYSDAVDLFRIYNSSGTPLTPQEIRNGVYQNNLLYKLINKFSEEAFIKNEKTFNKNWYIFSGVGGSNIGDKREIKKILTLLSYYFSFSYNVEKTNNGKNLFIKNKINLLEYIENKETEKLINFDKDQESFEKYNKFYRKKGSLENMINTYSEYVADKGSEISLLEEEFNTIKSFFDLYFEEKDEKDRFNFFNLCMIYIIIRANRKLENKNIVIPRDAIYYEPKGNAVMNPIGFYNRLRDIYLILLNKGVI